MLKSSFLDRQKVFIALVAVIPWTLTLPTMAADAFAASAATVSGTDNGRQDASPHRQSRRQEQGPGRRGGGRGPAGGSAIVYDVDPSVGFSISRAEESLARMSVALDLSEAQQQQIREIMQESSTGVRQIVRRVSAKRRALMTLDSSDDDFEATMDRLSHEIATGIQELLIRSVNLRVDIGPVLSKEQRQKLMALPSTVHQRQGTRRRRGHDGQGHDGQGHDGQGQGGGHEHNGGLTRGNIER